MSTIYFQIIQKHIRIYPKIPTYVYLWKDTVKDKGNGATMLTTAKLDKRYNAVVLTIFVGFFLQILNHTITKVADKRK